MAAPRRGSRWRPAALSPLWPLRACRAAMRGALASTCPASRPVTCPLPPGRCVRVPRPGGAGPCRPRPRDHHAQRTWPRTLRPCCPRQRGRRPRWTRPRAWHPVRGRWAAARSRASFAPPRARAAPVGECCLCGARARRPTLPRPPVASKFQNSPCPVSPPASFKFQHNLSPVNSFPPPPGSSPRADPVLPASSATPVAVSVDARPLVPIVTLTPTQFLGPDARRQRRYYPYRDP